MSNKKYQKLIDAVLEEIVKQVNLQDVTAIEELIKSCPTEMLVAFLSEEDQEPFKEFLEGNNE